MVYSIDFMHLNYDHMYSMQLIQIFTTCFLCSTAHYNQIDGNQFCPPITTVYRSMPESMQTTISSTFNCLLKNKRKVLIMGVGVVVVIRGGWLFVSGGNYFTHYSHYSRIYFVFILLKTSENIRQVDCM